MPNDPDQLQQILDQLGVSKESIQNFKFGGVVGKLALIIIAGLFAVAACLRWASNPWIQGIAIIVIPGITILVAKWLLNYAERHPMSATMEGGELIVWRQQQIMLATKGQKSFPESPIIPEPGSTPPQLNPPGGSDE